MQRRIRFCLLTTLALTACWPRLADAQGYDTLKICTYNLLNYPNISSTRNPEFRKTIRYVDPDILLAEEMTSSAGVIDFLNNVLNYGQPGTYSAAPYITGGNPDCACFYKPSKVSYQSQVVLETELRDIPGYQLRPVGLSSDSLDLWIYAAHLKAGDTGPDESQRRRETDTLRTHLNSRPDAYHLIACGDFNTYSSSDSGYQMLIGSQTDNSGRLYDPINSPGNWSDNASFAPIHTQSPRVRNLGDGGAIGGLDDRFDFILPDYDFQTAPGWQYVSGSYNAVGNDGNHWNDSINQPPNNAVPDSVANALHFASDHLPVVLKIRRQVGPTASITLSAPNGGELWYVGQTGNIAWSSLNLSGNVKIEIDRTYPSANWTTLLASTLDDGSEPWTVTGSASATTRIRITSVSYSNVGDTSAADFTVADPVLSLVAPNGGETWNVASLVSISWTAAGLSGNLSIELNRSYPSTNWEVLSSSTPVANGSASWTVSLPATSQARVRITSLSNPSTGDTSAANFAIVNPLVFLTSPNGGESWTTATSHIISWTSNGLTGNIRIDLNRTYPSAFWETIFSSVPVAGASINWTVTAPVTSQARIRLQSLSVPAAADTSNTDFSIVAPPIPPVIVHDPHGDGEPGALIFTVKITDDLPGVSGTHYYRPSGSGAYLAKGMYSTGNPAEFSDTVSLGAGKWQYYLQATDAGLLTTQTSVYEFVLEEACGISVSYDDGSSELFNHSQQTGFEWAVRFSPPALPFVICEARIAVAGFHPDTLHQLVRVQLFAVNGGGLPGTLLRDVTRGSVGNTVAGLPSPGAYWTTVVLHDSLSLPVEVNGDFFVAVSNTSVTGESFALDQSSPNSGRSFFWDPCDSAWFSEQSADTNANPGNRMIRINGWIDQPTEVVIHREGDDIHLYWSPTGAVYYKLYKSLTPNDPVPTWIATTSSSDLLLPGQVSAETKVFYRVYSSSAP